MNTISFLDNVSSKASSELFVLYNLWLKNIKEYMRQRSSYKLLSKADPMTPSGIYRLLASAYKF